MSPRRLILASRSPQRRAILEQLGIAFEVRAADVEELEEGDPERAALENARRKAAEISAHAPEAFALGVDTVVALGSKIYGKPADAGQARRTLAALSGRRHAVIGGICLIEDRVQRTAIERTTVEFRALAVQDIDWYLSSGEWRDRAGGYAIQGRGAALVRRIDGDYLNVVGLPVARLLELAPWLLSPVGAR